MMNKLTGFDGMRAVACLWIMSHHLVSNMDVSVSSVILRGIFIFLHLGSIGVSIFFVLSGALLSLPFWHNWLKKDEFPSIKNYTSNRLSRIVPGFYISLTISVLFSVIFFGSVLDSQLLIRYLSGLTFTNPFHWVTFFPSDNNGPLWSIGFEVIAYILLVPLMILMYKIKNRKTHLGIIYWFGVLVICLGMHLTITQVVVTPVEARGLHYGLLGIAKNWIPHYNPIGMFSHFLLGIVAAGILNYLKVTNVCRHKWFDIISLLTAMSAIFLLFHFRYNEHAYNGVFDNLYFWPWFPIAIAILLVCLPFSKHIGGLIDNRFFQYVAKISFGLYLWHFLIIEILHHTLFPNFTIMGYEDLSLWLIPSILTIAISFAVADSSYRYIEKPILIVVRKKELILKRA